ncbi:uncharacterized protein LOC121376184 isoform X2 [Gigantopelta aegis]|nr:uncharacterized protein LOC121376184 isoform X2 [Gigantopelta aegis]XP_041359937.1 uncharacterized protein LOC121376184 isoform X2 [Gigantopelta aegis]
MDHVDMDTGIIPIRHSSLPGQVRLPTRYDRAGTNRNTRTRKVSQAQAPRDGLVDRLDDLMTAMMWVKQELILLRQHDILLKRQFFNIQDTIHSLKPKSPEPSDQDLTSSTTSLDHSENYMFENFVVRASSSVTMLNGLEEKDDEEEVHDVFRPRTCSMRTSRDLAALARRRGSKDLV